VLKGLASLRQEQGRCLICIGAACSSWQEIKWQATLQHQWEASGKPSFSLLDFILAGVPRGVKKSGRSIVLIGAIGYEVSVFLLAVFIPFKGLFLQLAMCSECWLLKVQSSIRPS
jgi:hypothetical protein